MRRQGTSPLKPLGQNKAAKADIIQKLSTAKAGTKRAMSIQIQILDALSYECHTMSLLA